MKTKTPKSNDRRVQRTCRSLRESLIQLILECGWNQVTVQGVCDRADVGRSTFYTHFADLEDLLVSGFDELHRTLRAQEAAQAGASRPLGFVRGLIEHAADQQRLFRAVIGKRSGLAVQKRFRRLILDLVQEDLAELAPAGPRRDGAVHLLAGSFVELLIWWVDTRSALRTGEVDELFQELTAPVLAVIQKACAPRAGRENDLVHSSRQ